MERRLWTAIILALIALFSPRDARGGNWRFGLEWGAFPAVFSSGKYSFLTEDGYLIQRSENKWGLALNGELLSGIGWDFSDHWTTMLKTGYAGISKDIRIVPFLLETTYSFTGNDSGWALCLSGGAGLNEHFRGPVSYLGNLGAAYRIPLTSFLSMDLKAGLRAAWTKPPLYDGAAPVPESDIRRNQFGVVGGKFTIAFHFAPSKKK